MHAINSAHTHTPPQIAQTVKEGDVFKGVREDFSQDVLFKLRIEGLV